MTIGTSLHHQLASRHFTRLDDEISSLQGQIASGKADPRASVDPVRSLNISATQDQKAIVTQFSENLTAVDNRLSMSDTVLGEVTNVLNRFAEIGIRGATASVSESERESLRIEAVQLRDSLMALARSRDNTGRALFGGYQTQVDPFVDDGTGVRYVGDTGRHALRVSENATMLSGLNGQEVFMEIPVETANGTEMRDIFSLVDDMLHSLTAGGGSRQASVSGTDALRLDMGSAVGQVSMTLTGPNGSADISAPYMAGSMDAMIAAINAETATTGLTAMVDPDDASAIRLTGTGAITASNLDIEGGNERENQQITVTPYDGAEWQVPVVMVAPDMTADSIIGKMNDSLFHIADRRGEIGAVQQVGQRHATALNKRVEMVERALAGYEGLDIAAAVTELQALMMNREAAQQTYAKISVRTLFDFLG